MVSITIRRLDEGLKASLRLRAARHGRSMEEEAREILKAGVAGDNDVRADLGASIRRHLAPFGGVELSLPARQPMRRPPNLGK